jgi:hypothetical protein
MSTLPINLNPCSAPTSVCSVMLCCLDAGVTIIARFSTTFGCYFNVDGTAGICSNSVANISRWTLIYLDRLPMWCHRTWEWRSCRHGNAGNTTSVIQSIVTTAAANMPRGAAAVVLSVLPMQGWNIVYRCQINVAPSQSLCRVTHIMHCSLTADNIHLMRKRTSISFIVSGVFGVYQIVWWGRWRSSSWLGGS